MDNSIPRPNIFSDLTPSQEVVTPQTEGQPSEEEISLNLLRLSDGWRIIDQYMQELVSELDGTVASLMATPNTTFEEIGQKATLAALVKEYVNRIRHKVVDAGVAINQEIKLPNEQNI